MLSGIVAAIQVLTASSIYTPTPESVSKAPRRDVEAERTVDDDGMLSPVPEADEGKLVTPFIRCPASLCCSNRTVTDESFHGAASPLVTPGDSPTQAEPQMSLRGLLSNTSFRGPALLCASILGLQQLSGVNAVMFYSTPVLKPILPSSAGFIGIQITFVNALMTIVAIFLVDVRSFRLSCSKISLMRISANGAETSIARFERHDGHLQCCPGVWAGQLEKCS